MKRVLVADEIVFAQGELRHDVLPRQQQPFAAAPHKSIDYEDVGHATIQRGPHPRRDGVGLALLRLA